MMIEPSGRRQDPQLIIDVDIVVVHHDIQLVVTRFMCPEKVGFRGGDDRDTPPAGQVSGMKKHGKDQAAAKQNSIKQTLSSVVENVVFGKTPGYKKTDTERRGHGP